MVTARCEMEDPELPGGRAGHDRDSGMAGLLVTLESLPAGQTDVCSRHCRGRAFVTAYSTRDLHPVTVGGRRLQRDGVSAA